MGTTIMTSAMWQSTMAEAPVRPNIASTTSSHSANTWMTNWRMEKSHAVCVTRKAVTRSIEIWSLLLGYRTSSITLLCVHIFLGECCEHSLRSLFYVRHVFAVEHNVMRWRISCNRNKNSFYAPRVKLRACWISSHPALCGSGCTNSWGIRATHILQPTSSTAIYGGISWISWYKIRYFIRGFRKFYDYVCAPTIAKQ